MPKCHDDTSFLPRKILLIKLRHHGDIILTTPVINNLRQHYPAAEIDVLLYKETVPILAHHPAIGQLYSSIVSGKTGLSASVGTGIRFSANPTRAPL